MRDFLPKSFPLKNYGFKLQGIGTSIFDELTNHKVDCTQLHTAPTSFKTYALLSDILNIHNPLVLQVFVPDLKNVPFRTHMETLKGQYIFR